jgi:hypothetical protein
MRRPRVKVAMIVAGVLVHMNVRVMLASRLLVRVPSPLVERMPMGELMTILLIPLDKPWRAAPIRVFVLRRIDQIVELGRMTPSIRMNRAA